MKFIPFLLTFLLAACAQQSDKSNVKEWDFDHNVFFEQQRLSENSYHVVVRTDGKVPFERLATFLMRQSLELCKNYGFKIEVLSGVEEFDTRRSFPNLIMSNLSANVECPH